MERMARFATKNEPDKRRAKEIVEKTIATLAAIGERLLSESDKAVWEGLLAECPSTIRYAVLQRMARGKR